MVHVTNPRIPALRLRASLSTIASRLSTTSRPLKALERRGVPRQARAPFSCNTQPRHGIHDEIAFRSFAPSRASRLPRVPIPEIGPTDVLIRVEKAGVCGTDYHIYSWDKWAQNRIHPPLVVGHEFMGIVHAVGSAVRAVVVGDRVSAEGHIADLTCVLCRTGQAHICERVKIIGVDCPGAFAEYIAMPEAIRN